ncbi:phospholipase D-like domain-containing protein [Acinetobacter sp. MD2(2019)]|uniref:phospholipase D-like domain-containing protein n=1 Tax=Acinetobacter sp. MD2(2019) TaxID=2605273 RepID=UPI002D1F57B4|nr:phospholipase D-like domain-containing protein [Acinetobacter sp. MD2(2019)]MEB3754266.1 phospholipase [Acinetobacter sp. MD2(2019)]
MFQRLHQKLNWSKRRYIGLIVGALMVGYLCSAVYQTVKPLPHGLDFAGKLRPTQVQLISDQTYVDAQGKQQLDHHIFDAMLSLIQQAKQTIVLDQFLFNAEVGDSKQQHRALMQQLVDALVQKRLQNPNIQIDFITDPINSAYGGMAPEHYRQLRQAGVNIIETNLLPLRASNPVWSGLWYLCCQDIKNNSAAGWLPNPVGQGKVTLRSYLALLNFKANHRKTLVVDTDDGWKALVSSMNPHDGSSRHDNVALLISGQTAVDVLNSEQPVANMSKADNFPTVIVGDTPANPTLPQAQVLTEQAIYRTALQMIEQAQPSDQLNLAMFYLSERNIIHALKQAKQRGVVVQVLLDPNKDAFGRQKNGIPNRQVASELHKAGVNLRWCDTQGEQCHSKMLLKIGKTNSELLLGSANFTARNLKNYNLETDVHVLGASTDAVFRDAAQYFNTAWSNLNGRQMSVDYAKYADESTFKYWTYRVMEWSGISTF